MEGADEGAAAHTSYGRTINPLQAALVDFDAGTIVLKLTAMSYTNIIHFSTSTAARQRPHTFFVTRSAIGRKQRVLVKAR